MSISKAWDWIEGKSEIWLEPSEESYFLSDRWRKFGYKTLLDYGCGLGRHSAYFARQGFAVAAFDLSADGTDYLRAWAQRENLNIDVRVADMLDLPYADCGFDCLLAYHVISHSDNAGVRRQMAEIRRVLRPGGEAYVTFCSKDSWVYREAGFPVIDANTVRKTEDGPEKDVPHWHADLDDIISLFGAAGLELLRVRHKDECYSDGAKTSSKHYFVLARKPK